MNLFREARGRLRGFAGVKRPRLAEKPQTNRKDEEPHRKRPKLSSSECHELLHRRGGHRAVWGVRTKKKVVGRQKKQVISRNITNPTVGRLCLERAPPPRSHYEGGRTYLLLP